MNHGQHLRDLLEPLGVYRWEGSFQWGELQSEGAALDGVADALASLQQEMNLTTAQGEGLDRVLELLGRGRCLRRSSRWARLCCSTRRCGPSA